MKKVRVAGIDSAFDRTSTAKDHVLAGKDEGVVARKLNDGREFRIVKLFYEPEGLAAQLDALGWSSKLERTANYFIHGEAQPPSRCQAPWRSWKSGTNRASSDPT